MDYPVQLERDDNDTILVSFPDFPEAHTFGDTEADALAHAADALATVIDAYMKDRRDIPLPSVATGGPRAAVPALVAAKVALYRAMRAAKVNKSELARRMDVHLPQIDRLLAVHHGSQFEQLDAAFRALGKRMVVGIEDIPSAPALRRRSATTPVARKAAKARRRAVHA